VASKKTAFKVERWVPTSGEGINERGGLVPVIGEPANLAASFALADAAGAGLYRIESPNGGSHWRRVYREQGHAVTVTTCVVGPENLEGGK
jgi:hypothetical protein